MISPLKAQPRQSEGRDAINVMNWKFIPRARRRKKKKTNQKTRSFKLNLCVYTTGHRTLVRYRTELSDKLLLKSTYQGHHGL